MEANLAKERSEKKISCQALLGIKKNRDLLGIFFFLLLSVSVSAGHQDDSNSDSSRLYKEALQKYKVWNQSRDNDVLIEVVNCLKKARSLILINQKEIERSKLLKDVSTMLFWSKKSLLVSDNRSNKLKSSSRVSKTTKNKIKKGAPSSEIVDNKKIQNVEKERYENSSIASARIKQESILQKRIENLPSSDFPTVRETLKEAMVFASQFDHLVYQSEFMLRDVYFTYPETESAKIAYKMADEMSSRVSMKNEEDSQNRRMLLEDLEVIKKPLLARDYESVYEMLLEKIENENDSSKKQNLFKLADEIKVLKQAIEVLSQIYQVKKKDYPTTKEIGINRGREIVGVSMKGFSIRMANGGVMKRSWRSMKDDQLSKLITMSLRGQMASPELAVAIYLLGNSVDSFRMIDDISYREPALLAPYNDLIIKIRYDFRKEMKIKTIETINSARVSFSKKNTVLALSKLNRFKREELNSKYLADLSLEIRRVLENEFNRK